MFIPENDNNVQPMSRFKAVADITFGSSYCSLLTAHKLFFTFSIQTNEKLTTFNERNKIYLYNSMWQCARLKTTFTTMIYDKYASKTRH